MALSEIENQLGADHIVLRHACGRTIAFAAAVLTWALALGLMVVLPPAGRWWHDAFYGSAAAVLAYVGFVVAVQAVRGIALLEASESGIAINSRWGPISMRWRDVAEFSAGDYHIEIRLREGARPVASTWTRIANASVWARRTIVVPLFTTGTYPTGIAMGLSALRARYDAA